MAFNIFTFKRLSYFRQDHRIDHLIRFQLRGDKCPISRQFLVAELHFPAIFKSFDPIVVLHFRFSSCEITVLQQSSQCSPNPNGLSWPRSAPEQSAGFLAFRNSHYFWFSRDLTAAVRAAAINFSPSRADFAMRGFAISLVTLARVASPDSFLVFFFIGPPP
jgi:hypothetical protein